MQHLFPWGVTIGVDYSASHSSHLPYSSFSGTANRNFLPSSIRKQIVAQYNTCVAGAADPATCVTPSETLATLVANPFQPLFHGPNAIFNEPESIYNNATFRRSIFYVPIRNLMAHSVA